MGRARQEEIDSLLERIRAGGTKISETAARATFSEIEENRHSPSGLPLDFKIA